MIPIAAALQAVHLRIAEAARAAGRASAQITLVAVTKTFPAEAIRVACAAGQRDFGENYVQEALDKVEALRELTDVRWHLIGPLQSNKAHAAAQAFSWVHTLDRMRIAKRLSDARPALLPPLSCCIQVNVSGEQSKSGVQPSAALALAREIVVLPRLHLRGFMAICAPNLPVSAQRRQFGTLDELLKRARAEGLMLDTLSMGMSDDLEAAIAEGATIVRVGRAIFGPRGEPPEPASGAREAR